MGKRFVELLKTRLPDVHVVTVNRGNVYWSWSECGGIVCDRNNRIEYRNRISEILNRYEWIGAIDFCAFKPKDVSHSLPPAIFNGYLFPIYILISTDSVYEVMDLENATCVDESFETPSFPSRDRYGFNKLMTETTARELSSSNQYFLSLRLPDVIGPFDDTYRLWSYVHWLKSGIPVFVPRDNTPLAFVYSEDVVEFCLGIFQRAPKKDSGYAAVNLLCEEQITLHDFLQLVAHSLNFNCDDFSSQGTIPQTYYPSVEYRKVPLSRARAQKLGFRSTPLSEAIRTTLAWLEAAQSLHKREYNEMIMDLPNFIARQLSE